MPNINSKQIRYNYSKRTSAIKYITIHDTANAGASAANHRNYFNNGDRNASADFFVDGCGTIEQLVVDLKRYKTWSVGDGRGRYGIDNNNSISIELCLEKDGSVSRNTYNEAVWLTKKLKLDYGIADRNVVLHWHASRKNCSRVLRENKSSMKWDNFIKDVNGAGVTPSIPELDNTEMYRVRKVADNATTQVGAYTVLASARECADLNRGTFVFNNSFDVVYPSNETEQDGIYRVRLTASDATSQKGAFKDIKNAIDLCNDFKGYSVYDEDFNIRYTNGGTNKHDFWDKSCNASTNRHTSAFVSPSFSANTEGVLYSNERLQIESVVCDVNEYVPARFYIASNNTIEPTWLLSKDINIKYNARVIGINSNLLARYSANSKSNSMGHVYNNERVLYLKTVGAYKLCAYNTKSGIKIAYFTGKYIKEGI